jgi:hypothetical protein
MQDHLHTGFVQLAITTGFVIVAIHILRAGAVWLSARDSDLAQSSGKIIGSLVTFSNT